MEVLQKYPTSTLLTFYHSMFLHAILFLSFAIANESFLGSETDMIALLKFKESISDDPYGVLSSWNDSFHFCEWPGIACSSRHQRTTALNLGSYSLRGTISPYIGNLSFLRIINLVNNSFFGEIPSQVGRLFRLRQLKLDGNMLQGKIPVNLSFCSQLKILALRKNNLTGRIPVEIGTLMKLEVLNLSTNNLIGGIPPSLGNMSSLKEFSVGFNHLVGIVPAELGRLKNLTLFSIGPNNLSGTIPPSLYNLSFLVSFLIPFNRFHGTLPRNIGLTLPSLKIFGIAVNNFSGTIPESFSNASKLQQLDFDTNNFTGQVPTSLGNLPDLSFLSFSFNNLGNHLPNSLDFISSFTNCSRMEVFSLSANKFTGALPKSVANLSTQLTGLYLGANQISGNIPSSLENLVNLTILGLEGNLFTGVIPASLGNLPNLQFLDLTMNLLFGKIPSSLGNLSRLFKLNLSSNNLEGGIPIEIANCKNLQRLDLSNNSLSGTIPKELFGLLSSLIIVNLFRNSFSGSLPVEVGKLKSVYSLDLSENNLTGNVPSAIGDCESLELLYLQGNFFNGTLPYTLSSLKGLRHLDLSRNRLTGEIPKDLQNLSSLLYLNLSFNDLDGEVPNQGVFLNPSTISLAGNSKLCGGVPELLLPRCPVKESKQGNTHRLKLTIILVCVAAVFLLFSGFIIFFWKRNSRRKLSPEKSTIGFLSKVSYKTLYEATDGFSRSMLIGTGSFGSVYKGIVDQEENPIAVKVLNLQQRKAEKSFIAECHALRHVRHRNLVKILTCCSSIDNNGNEFKALVFDYMPNGSLEKWLHQVTEGENRSRGLSLVQRLNITIEVASAIYYLHNDCDQPVIHRDLKPSNILLDNDMIAHISDFGLARLVSRTTDSSQGQASTIGIKGTIGYVAPAEYAMGGEPSKQGDVYSYGILVLEMFTGKRPVDEMFKDDFNLRSFVTSALPPERLARIVDSALLPAEVEETTDRSREGGRSNGNNGGTEIEEEGGNNTSLENPNQMSSTLQECLVSVLKIGLACSEDSPNERMNMEDVIRELQHIKNAYLGVGIRGQRRRTS